MPGAGMAVTKFGSQTYKFGFEGDLGTDGAAIAATIGIQPKEITISLTPEFEAEGKNLFNETEAWVRGSDKFEFTLNGYIVDEDLFYAADAFNFTIGGETRALLIQNRRQTVSNSEFTMGELTGLSYPLITSTTGTDIN